jgi:hypothetical protein
MLLSKWFCLRWDFLRIFRADKSHYLLKRYEKFLTFSISLNNPTFLCITSEQFMSWAKLFPFVIYPVTFSRLLTKPTHNTLGYFSLWFVHVLSRLTKFFFVFFATTLQLQIQQILVFPSPLLICLVR